MIHLVVTKHLVYYPEILGVYERPGCVITPYLFMMEPPKRLGSLASGPNLPIDLDIIEEWKDLQEYVSSTVGRS